VPWPTSAEALVAEQVRLAATTPEPWRPAPDAVVGACFVCFPRGPSGPGRAGDPAWAAAAVGESTAAVTGVAGAPYEPGLLALREGPILQRAVEALPWRPDVLLVNATGRDHPRRAGLALHLGAVLDLPTVGITHRMLLAAGEEPDDEPGARTPIHLAGELVGYWLRTRRGCRPVAIGAAWRTDPAAAVEVVVACSKGARTPEPLRLARQAARTARSAQQATGPSRTGSRR
jgi:deoxyribonuclease V